MRRFLYLLAAVALVAAGCSDTPSSTTTSATTTTSVTTSATTTTAATTTTSTTAGPVVAEPLNLYFFLDSTEPTGPFLAAVAAATPGCCADELISTLDALIQGPSQDQADLGISSAIPGGTVLLGVDVDGGVAVVDLSNEFTSGGGSFAMEGRVAEIVWTATQFDGIDSVRFAVGGTVIDFLGGEGIDVSEPRTRANTTSTLPAILIEEPAFGATVPLPFTLAGMGNVFEGAFLYAVVDADGRIVLEDFTMAQMPEIGVHGPYSLQLSPDVEGPGGVIVWEQSAQDGSQINVVEYPVVFVAG